jgi:hypothetical protein
MAVRTLIGLVAVTVLALGLPSVARADHNEYQTFGFWEYGPGWLGRPHPDASCVWYRGQAGCSGWNEWGGTEYWRQVPGGGDDFTYLHGLENNDRIRGGWVYRHTPYHVVGRYELGMPPYNVAHITWWSGVGVSVLERAT